ncbi:O-antigen ligase [Candidatus Methylobacter favarea]|uniref:O-antigen ligase n=1 Tax=Candidatus Methylobacter favarea TaxID=2707345 RepID=A0A8S0WLC7_9GAMM|nr:O-antigen ligase family protein [Candidatus Methylobacter favarea]CAA9892530.1 O-antigen ligase [Candidatus Methylobacter favarea]
MKKKLGSFSILDFVVILAAVLCGLFSVGFVGVSGEKPSLLMALPAVMIIGLLFVLDRYLLFMLILMFRPVLDPVLDKTKMGSFSVGAILNALVIIIAAIAIFQKDFELRSFLIKIWAPFLVVLLVTVGFAPEFMSAIKMYLQQLSNTAMFTLGIFLVKTQADYGRWMRVLLISSLIPVFYGFFDYATGGVVSADGGMRVASTFTHPNILAFYLLLIMTLSFYFIKSRVVYIPSAFKRMLPLYIIMMIVLLLFTKTRSAWAACFAFFALYGLLYERRYLVLVIVSPIAAFFIPEVRDRIVDLTQGNEVVTYGTLNSYAWRKYIWESGLNWMKPSHYFLGYGVEAFMHYSLVFFPLAGGIQRGAHNVYVQLFFDTGAIGLLSFIWLFGSVAYYLAKFYKTNKLMIFLAIMLLCQYALIAYSDNLLSYLAFNWYFWFIIGATYSIAYYDKKRIENEIVNNT